MRPPDNYPLVAAWRDVVARVLIFLLEKSSSRKVVGSSQYLVLVVGVAERVKQIGRSVKSIKGNLDKAQQSELEGQRVERRLDTETRRKPAVKFSVAIGIFTAVVNALSLYLKRVDPPLRERKIANSLSFDRRRRAHRIRIAPTADRAARDRLRGEVRDHDDEVRTMSNGKQVVRLKSGQAAQKRLLDIFVGAVRGHAGY